ncbi:hypothetical protein GVX86_00130 [[Haemophilus] felis]|nr:hypothetical protein [[Haemophilus] felis]
MIKRRSKEIDLYYIDKDYIAFMKSVESRIQHNYDNQTNKKPYVGVVLMVNNKTYFAPLTSAKEKHRKIANSDPTTFKIFIKGKFKASVLLNNMIPVDAQFIKRIDIRAETNSGYREFLSAEYKVLTLNAETLKAKAATLYKAVLKGENKYFCHVSYHFTVLEKALENYLNAKQGE